VDWKVCGGQAFKTEKHKKIIWLQKHTLLSLNLLKLFGFHGINSDFSTEKWKGGVKNIVCPPT
jgi:hypothetical protein